MPSYLSWYYSFLIPIHLKREFVPSLTLIHSGVVVDEITVIMTVTELLIFPCRQYVRMPHFVNQWRWSKWNRSIRYFYADKLEILFEHNVGVGVAIIFPKLN